MDRFQFKKRVLFIGVPDMALVGLDTLLYSGVNIVAAIGPLKTHNTYNQFKNFVKSRNVNFIEYDRLDEENLLNTIRGLNIDIAVVCSFNNKIPKVFMDTIKDGILNLHPSLLPKYRGGNPYSRAIMNGDEKTGVTIHFMSEEFDKGDIVSQEECSIDSHETMGTLFNKTNHIGCKMLLKTLIYYEQHNTLPRTKQPDGEFEQAPNIKEKEMIINYNNTAVEIDRLVRALNPYLTAMTFFKNQILKIHKVSIANLNNIDSFENGQICKITPDKIYVKTADGCITPEVLQYSGYFCGDCSDFIKIVDLKVGDKFTNGYT